MLMSPYDAAAILGGQVLTPELFGCVGDGVTNDSVNFQKFLTALPGKVGLMLGTYKVTTLLTLSASGCTLLGIAGQSKISSTFGYNMLLLSAASNATIDGIIFENLYVNAVGDNGASVYSNFDVSVINFAIRNCQFTVPNAATSALAFFGNTGATAGKLDGVWVEDNIFDTIGRIGVTFMNRSATIGNARRVYCNRNKFNNTGCVDAATGWAVSFDGIGEGFTCNDNALTKCRVYGLENAAWSYGTFERNTFDDFSSTWAPFSCSGGVQTGISFVDNKCLSAANATMPMYQLADCTFRGNIFNASTSLIEFRNMNRCRFINDKYITSANSVIVVDDVGGASQNNIWRDCRFDNSAAGGNVAPVIFDGAVGGLTNYNRVTGCNFSKAAGGNYVKQQNGAINNVATDIYDAVGNRINIFVGFSMPDANSTVSGDSAVLDADVLIINNGGIAAPRQLTLALETWCKSKTVINNTAQTITLVGPGGAGSALAAGDRKVVMYRGDVQQFFTTN